MRLAPLFAALLLLASSSASAGNWSSGGGVLLKDDGNPWFLGNVKTVHYCIATDAAHVSASPDALDRSIRKALDYWRQQFRFAQFDRDAELLRTAGQDFVREACPASLDDALKTMDVVFQFGVLTEEQRQYLKDPPAYIAVSVRTDYDRKTLRGKGFVYVSADSGPLRYRGDSLVDQGWRDGDKGPLVHVLTHEFGHVFGLPHTGTEFEIMGEGYPGFVLTPFDGKPLAAGYLFNFFEPSEQFFVGLPGDQMFCMPENRRPGQGVLRPLLRFFFLDEALRCVRVRIETDRAVVHYKTSPDGEEILAGTLPFDQDPVHQYEEERYIGRIGLTPEQQVFTNLSDLQKLMGYVPGAKVVDRYRTGTYTDARTGQKRVVQLKITPKQIVIGGLFDDGLVFDIFRTLRPDDLERRGVR